jgi:hypothetical protein
MNLDNSIFAQTTGRAIHPFWSTTERMMLMYVTLGDLLMLLLVLIALVTLIKSFYDNKKK